MSFPFRLGTPSRLWHIWKKCRCMRSVLIGGRRSGVNEGANPIEIFDYGVWRYAVALCLFSISIESMFFQDDCISLYLFGSCVFLPDSICEVLGYLYYSPPDCFTFTRNTIWLRCTLRTLSTSPGKIFTAN
ncbi:hypothetical protein MTP99_011893 [Tenebrio molitor]|nr:hypothetical protein MTP99_011893 [Tenebrio molitor]